MLSSPAHDGGHTFDIVFERDYGQGGDALRRLVRGPGNAAAKPWPGKLTASVRCPSKASSRWTDYPGG